MNIININDGNSIFEELLNQMAILIIGMIILGIILVVLEILVIPGLISGIIGVLLILSGIWMSYDEFGVIGGNITLIGSILGTLFSIYWSFKRGSWKRFSLQKTIDSHVNEVRDSGIEIGTKGLAVSALRPSGSVEINDKIIEAQSLGEWIDTNTSIEVIIILPNKVIVKSIS